MFIAADAPEAVQIVPTIPNDKKPELRVAMRSENTFLTNVMESAGTK